MFVNCAAISQWSSQGFIGWCLAGFTVCWVGLAVRDCFASYWQPVCRRWCLDGAGVVCVLQLAELFGRHLSLFWSVLLKNNTNFNESLKLKSQFETQLQIIYFYWRTLYHCSEDNTCRSVHCDALKTQTRTSCVDCTTSYCKSNTKDDKDTTFILPFSLHNTTNWRCGPISWQFSIRYILKTSVAGISNVIQSTVLRLLLSVPAQIYASV